MKKKVLILIISVFIILSGTFMIGLTGKEDVQNSEADNIKNALQGAFETEMQLGSFQSSDGTTSTLTDAELDQLIDDYSRKVDKYYLKSYFKQESYSWLNEYYLRSYFKTHIGSCQGGGASDCVIDELEFPSENQAKVTGSIACWNQWIVKEDDCDYYEVQYPIDVIEFEFIMEKDGDDWKLKQCNKFNPDQIESLDTKTLNSMEISSRLTEERNTVISQHYDSYESALAALKALNEGV